jgi:hypothetical protein
VEIKRERETAERGKDLECRERRREKSVDSDESVINESCWVWN